MIAFSTPRFLRVVWFSALYDLVLAAPFATPWTFELNRAQLSALNQALGGPVLPAFGVVQTLFVLLMGSIVGVWSVLRLRGPTVLFGRYDGVGRLLFSLWMAWAWSQGGLPVLLLFLLPELAWAVVQLWPVRAR
ncbi:hypothetical protein [Roseateles sp.]|uniref:hypothetical protein n=1 Tax=Roseateles sp. TaxID=1971397 RepID=UPI0025E098EB|nr:hypothetical protein [Roseateles sp.]MBV8035952.1 hypothetical protein [Roseateles sp.]